MSLEHWQNRWREGRIGWHRDHPHPWLEEHLRGILPNPENARVLVPLCGKSLDMKWILDQGVAVVGVEFVSEALQAFCDEQALEATSKDIEGAILYRAKRFMGLAMNFLDTYPRLIGPVDAAYDRAAMIAVAPERRQAYADKLKELLGRSGKILLLTLSYPEAPIEGPPYSLPDDEVRELFSDCEIQQLESRVPERINPRFEEAGVTEDLHEACWEITIR